jgi:1-phosphatidylinositol-3-phosphate 5-kinase
MDYSLLLGLEKDKKEIVVGIVDSIGSFDLWKTLESKGKMLTRGGDVTVVSNFMPSGASLMTDST